MTSPSIRDYFLEVSYGALTVDTDDGVIIGDSQELTITVSSNDVTVAQTSQDKDLKLLLQHTNNHKNI